ncbi:MAG: restriction endonuclease subunit S [Chitinophagales bacterium]|nr:restriction endonuclease subunit S [Chitinophagales bacterium]
MKAVEEIKKSNLNRPEPNSIPEDWKWTEFGSVFKFLSTFSFSRDDLTSEKDNGELLYIHYGDIHAKFENEIVDFDLDNRVPFLIDGFFSKEDLEDDEFPLLQDGDLIIADASEDYEGVAECVELKNVKDKKIISGLHTIAARDKNGNTAQGFRTYIFNHPKVSNSLKRFAQGISVYSISKTHLAEIKIPLPPLAQQQSIAKLLTTWDNAITKMQSLIIQKQLNKKWLMQVLLIGKERINGFNEEWKMDFISNVTKRVRTAFSPELIQMYREIGIRSHVKGIFHKELKSGKDIGEKSVFWVEPDCFIFNIVFAWEHAIAKTTMAENGMIASHRFPMYKPKKGVMNLDFLLYYFSSPRGKYLLGVASPGGAGRNKTIGQTEFQKLQIPVPPIEEQNAIAELMQSADKEIQLLKSELEKLKEQKKGLMQQLLTGKLRVKNLKTKNENL